MLFALCAAFVCAAFLTACNPDEFDLSQLNRKVGTPFVLISAEGVASWDEVDNAIGYRYKIDNGEEINTTARSIQLNDGQSIQVKAVDDKAFVMQKFGMYDGKKEFVTLRFINPLLDTVIDKFGNKLFYQKVDDKHFSVQVEVPITDQFFGWLCSFGKRVKIISPPPIQDKFKEYLDKIRGIY